MLAIPEPHWYSKRVAFGRAQDGDYIDLEDETGSPWDFEPSVHIATASVLGFIADYDGVDHHFNASIADVSSSGFLVSIAVTTEDADEETIREDVDHSMGVEAGDSDEWEVQTTETTVIGLAIKITYDGVPPNNIKVEYREGGGSWIEVFSDSSVENEETVTVEIPNLDEDQYELRVTINSFDWPDDGIIVCTVEWWERTIAGIDYVREPGEITWIAVEGGVED